MDGDGLHADWMPTDPRALLTPSTRETNAGMLVVRRAAAAVELAVMHAERGDPYADRSARRLRARRFVRG
jgi:hypothetical protein